MAQREQINARLQEILDAQTEPWGIKVTMVELKNIDLNQEMQRAMAKQAEAERERRAKVIHAEQPNAIHLRFLQSLVQVAAEKNETIVVPIPIDFVTKALERLEGNSGPNVAQVFLSVRVRKAVLVTI